MKVTFRTSSFFAALGLAMLVVLSVYAADDPTTQSKPTFKGDVVAYEPGKYITIEAATSVGKRKMEFAIVKDKTVIKLLGDATEVKVGMVASVWADNDDKKKAAKIEVGTAKK